LELPPDFRIYPIIHVSQLKKYIAPLPEGSTELSIVCTDPQPVKILDHPMFPKVMSMVKQVLVTWSTLPEQMETCEEEERLHRRYPKLA
jgi:hypothetical protein